jgi:hypothetical protein
MSLEFLNLRKRILKRSKWNGECLETDYFRRKGYGLCKFRNKTIGAHRAFWISHKGEIPNDKQVCHTCDNRACIRIDHLFLGTAKDNTRDMFSKGRNKGNIKKNNHDIKIIRKCISLRRKGLTYKNIGIQCDLSWQSVVRIMRNSHAKGKVSGVYPKFKNKN